MSDDNGQHPGTWKQRILFAGISAGALTLVSAGVYLQIGAIGLVYDHPTKALAQAAVSGIPFLTGAFIINHLTGGGLHAT